MKAFCLIAMLLLCLPTASAMAQDVPAGKKPAVAGFEDMKAARAALDEIIRAYETGDIGLIQARLDPAMIGYQRFIDSMRRDATGLKQIRLHLFEAQVTAGPDVAMIQAAWEKRFFGVADFTPGLFWGAAPSSCIGPGRLADGGRIGRQPVFERVGRAGDADGDAGLSSAGEPATLRRRGCARQHRPGRPGSGRTAKRDDRGGHQSG
ncbi:MAG: nuclear transport factor 2 family protein [Rhodocyclaceae bacterium]|nr:nuclear transport factor 2 family protein [Rhodocyclaceae bacterium]